MAECTIVCQHLIEWMLTEMFGIRGMPDVNWRNSGGEWVYAQRLRHIGGARH
jgi:hypothetical protein